MTHNKWLSFDRCDDDRNYDMAMNDSLGMDCGGEYAESTYGSAVGSSGRESKPDYYYLQYYWTEVQIKLLYNKFSIMWLTCVREFSFEIK